MTSELLPVARAAGIDRLEARLDDQFADLLWQHEQRWEHLGPAARDWLRDVLGEVLRDVRGDVLALVCDLPPRVP